MVRKGIVNGALLKALTLLGDKEFFMVQGLGMPTPANVEVIDLALVAGLPDLLTTLKAIVNEASIGNYIISEDMKDKAPELFSGIDEIMQDIHQEGMSTIMLREFTKKCKFVVRVGDVSPLAAIALQGSIDEKAHLG